LQQPDASAYHQGKTSSQQPDASAYHHRKSSQREDAYNERKTPTTSQPYDDYRERNSKSLPSQHQGAYYERNKSLSSQHQDDYHERTKSLTFPQLDGSFSYHDKQPYQRNVYSKRLPCEDYDSCLSGVYVLKTVNNEGPPRFYVGKSENIEKRIKDHQSGAGVSYLAGCNLKRMPLLTEGSCGDLESWERNETLHRMYRFGINNVRGWMFTSKELSKDDCKAAFSQICEKYDLCRRCGRNSHFQGDCYAKTPVVWAGDMQI
jgi:hypothetical protein